MSNSGVEWQRGGHAGRANELFLVVPAAPVEQSSWLGSHPLSFFPIARRSFVEPGLERASLRPNSEKIRKPGSDACRL